MKPKPARPTPANDSRSVDWFGLVAFAVVVAVCVFVNFSVGLRVFGIWMVLTAFVQQVTGKLPFGWSGPKPSAKVALALNLVVGAIGLVIAVWPNLVMELFF